ncbi:MAG: hypothetical protein K1W19_03310 [Lachnospiraceae bacterium]
MRKAHNTIDKTGQKFNMLTVIERLANYKGTGKTYYKCLCECGNTKILPNDSVGKTYSCGCINKSALSQRIDYTGQKFNHLTVRKMLYNYKNNQTYCDCDCDCGNNTIVYMGSVKAGKTKSCGCIETKSRYNRKHSDDSIIGKKFGRLTVIKDSGKRYSNGSVMWLCKCDCGAYTYASSSKLKRGRVTSCGCAKKEFIESTKSDVIGKKFGYLTVIREVYDKLYKRRMVLCLCDCGNEIICAVSDLTTGHTMSCGCMCKSKGEKYVESLLKEFNILYETQKRFEDCKNKRKLPFDFYLPQYNTCIEYQGSQHYRPVEYWGGQEKFIVYQKNDSIKRQYCKDNNINLICLPYTLSNKEIKSKIFNILNP